MPFDMTNISVIILVGKEERHIGRCLERLHELKPRQVFVVESQSGDRTHDIAVAGGAMTVWNDWPGTQAKQFNWALDNLLMEGDWILRLDADEYLASDTIEKLKAIFSSTSSVNMSQINGLTFELRRKFCGGEIRHATNGIRQVRLFRRGKARYADTLMDELLIVDGKVIDFDGAFYDDSLMTMSEWRAKHRGYAKREAEQAIAGTYQDLRKVTYYKLPPYLRAVLYFGVRYLLKRGILDGYAGWMWNFWQGLWYRWIVDIEIVRRRKILNGLR